MVAEWLVNAAAAYNRISLGSKDSYPSHVLMPIGTLASLIEWSFRSLPDEILVGIDADHSKPNPKSVEEAFGGQKEGLFGLRVHRLTKKHTLNIYKN